jgi:hypothetical protein
VNFRAGERTARAIAKHWSLIRDEVLAVSEAHLSDEERPDACEHSVEGEAVRIAITRVPRR